MTAIFKFNLPNRIISKVAKSQFMELMGATDDVVASLTFSQRKMIERIIDYMNPASERSVGVKFDNKTRLPGERIAAVAAPTLVFHAKDDTLQLYHNAEFAVSTIPNARLVSFEHGGHVVMIVEQSTVRAALQEHVMAHAH